MKTILLLVVMIISMIWSLSYTMLSIRKELILSFKRNLKKYDKKMIDMIERFDKEEILIYNLLANEATNTIFISMSLWLLTFFSNMYILEKINLFQEDIVRFDLLSLFSIVMALILATLTIKLILDFIVKLFFSNQFENFLFELIKRNAINPIDNKDIESLNSKVLGLEKNQIIEEIDRYKKEKRIINKINEISDIPKLKEKTLENKLLLKELLKVALILGGEDIAKLKDIKLEMLNRIVEKIYLLLSKNENEKKKKKELMNKELKELENM